MLSDVTTPQDLDDRFREALAALAAPQQPRDPAQPVTDDATLTGARVLDLFDAQVTSRQLDLAARWLRSFGEGFYTIGSSGHEGNAAVAAALRPTDPALLHYRSGGFYCARAAQVGGVDPLGDVLRGIVASAQEPIAGGRHKVFGDPRLAVVRRTSTIASHLPRAVGLGYALEQSRLVRASRSTAGRKKADRAWPDDAIVVCSFGDASVNHAVAQAAFNTSGWLDHTGVKVPVLYVCEDNGIGISVRSPEGWVESVLRSRPGLRYLNADGIDAAATYDATVEAAQWVRAERRPAVLHLRMVRLMGHAGADAEIAYRTSQEISADLDRDPLTRTAA